ncbi:MAG: cytochrome b N-terminal domain-containing protein [Planctomycetia bacterium]|nr:cytochrome b N-terminal domain-containing protein [Planctomycetia bacterium]
MPGRLRQIATWLDSRLGFSDVVLPILRHPAPSGSRWWYVFGSATLTMLVLQIITGICLSLVYVPSAAEAYTSLNYLTYDQSLGWLLRAIHNTAASGMVILMVAHMVQVFLMGSFKYPREMTWVVGVALFVLTLGMAFTGQVLRWDQDSYWGVGVGAAMVGRVPYLGPALVRLLLGGTTIGADTLSRFFTLHVLILPGLLIISLSVHLFLVMRHGVSEPPVAGRLVSPATYDKQYAAVLKRGEPFFPAAVMRDMIFSAWAVIAVIGIAIAVGPKGPALPPDPSLISAEPRPDWYFLSLFALLALCPPNMETAIILIAPVIGLFSMVLVPFVAGKGERSPRRRPVAVLTTLVLLVGYGVLTWLGNSAPWSPQMDAWSGEPVPPRMLARVTPLELQGAVVFQNKTCRNCHALDGSGGRRGPDLTYVASSLDRDELIRQVIQGGGNMPAFGDHLSPSEVTALVAFLQTLRPSDTAPAASAATGPAPPHKGNRP